MKKRKWERKEKSLWNSDKSPYFLIKKITPLFLNEKISILNSE